MAIISDVKSTIGPSAPPTIAIEALSFKSSPNADAIGKVRNVPNSAQRAKKRLAKGFWSKKLTSSNVPIPINTKQAIRPLLNVRVYTGCKKSICIVFINSSVSESIGSRNKLPSPSPIKSVPQLIAIIPSPIGIITIGSRIPFHPK